MKSPRQPSTSSGLDLHQWPPIFEEWRRSAPARFETLYKEIQNWGSGKRHGQFKRKLLGILDEVKKHNLEWILTGHLRQAIFQSPLRSAMHKEKQDRSVPYKVTIACLDRAAEGLRQLAQRDKTAATLALLVSGPSAAGPRQAASDWKQRQADQLHAYARSLQQEQRDFQKAFSYQRWGKSKGRPHINLEWVVQLREQLHEAFGVALSPSELALLLEAALGAWTDSSPDIERGSLKRSLGRFRKRNPESL
jgi:hypothetical protein